MNAITTISAPIALALPDDLTADQWLDLGRDLASQKRTLDWLVGDWLNVGMERFPEQLELALPQISDDAKAVMKIGRIAAAFSPDQRYADLSFAHHAHVATLPAQEAKALLERARREHINARQLRLEAVKVKVQIGQQTIFTDEDFDHHELLNLQRAWNKAQPHVRREFVAMIEEAQYGEIDA